MNKQEKVREGMYDIIEDRVLTKTLHTGKQIGDLVTELQKFEASQGVVIKVERELPALPLFRWIGYGEEKTARLAYDGSQQDMLKAGFGVEKDGKTYAVEPLVGKT